jgi:hypothetical protein
VCVCVCFEDEQLCNINIDIVDGVLLLLLTQDEEKKRAKRDRICLPRDVRIRKKK